MQQLMGGLQAGRGPWSVPRFTPFFGLTPNFCAMSPAVRTPSHALSSPATQSPASSDQFPQNHSTDVGKEAFLS